MRGIEQLGERHSTYITVDDTESQKSVLTERSARYFALMH